MKILKKFLSFFLVLAMAASVFAGCGSSKSEGNNTNGESYDKNATITYAMTGGWDSLCPFYWSTAGFYGTLVWDKLYDSLVYCEPDGSFSPRGAKSWTMDDSMTVMTFTLDEKATFSDGEPVTAYDWEWTANLLANPDFEAPDYAQVCSLWAGTDDTGKLAEGETLGVKALDDYTIEITLKNPNSFNSYFTTYNKFLFVLPMHCFEGVAAADVLASNFWSNPVCSGPFTVESEVVNSTLTLIPNEHYHLGAPQFGKLVMTVMSAENFTSALMSGDIDVCYPSLSASEASAATSVEGLTVEKSEVPNYLWHMSINHSVVPDARVRKAMSLAIDKNLIAEQLFEGDAVATDSIEIPGSILENKNLAYKGRDVDGAKALLKEAGWDSSKSLTLATPSGIRASIAAIIQQQLAEVGITVEVETVDIGTMFSGLYAGTYDLGMIGGSPCYDPLYMNSNWNYNSYGFYKITDKTYMDLAGDIIKNSNEEASYKEAVDAYTQYLYDETTCVPIVFQYNSAVYNSRLKNYNALAPNFAFDNVCDWLVVAE